VPIYSLSGTGLVECLEIIDVRCKSETVRWLDLTDQWPWPPDFTTYLRQWLRVFHRCVTC